MFTKLRSRASAVRRIAAVFRKSARESRRYRRALRRLPCDDRHAEARVVFLTLRKGHYFNYPVELLLAHLLARTGHQVSVILDDGVLGHWDSVQNAGGDRALTPYQAHPVTRLLILIPAWFLQRAHRHPNLRILKLSRVLREMRWSEAGANDPRDRSFALSSTKRRFETDQLDRSDPRVAAYYDDSLRNARISRTVGNYIAGRLRPDLFCASHGIYSLWGPCAQVVREASIQRLFADSHGHTAARLLIADQPAQTLLRSSDWQAAKDRQLTPEEVEAARSFLGKRVARQEADSIRLFGEEIRRRRIDVDRNDDCRVFGLFPNVVWDGDVEERNTIFEGLVACIRHTIAAFRRSPHHLVIRFHPSETTVLKGTKPLVSILRDIVPGLDEIPNVHLIHSDESIDPYQFAKGNIDIGIVYCGVLALELTHLGIPVIACGQGPYTSDTFVFAPDTREQYSVWLAHPSIVLSRFAEQREERLAALYRFTHWYRYEAAYGLPILDTRRHHAIRTASIGDPLHDPSSLAELRRTLGRYADAARRPRGARAQAEADGADEGPAHRETVSA